MDSFLEIDNIISPDLLTDEFDSQINDIFRSPKVSFQNNNFEESNKQNNLNVEILNSNLLDINLNGNNNFYQDNTKILNSQNSIDSLTGINIDEEFFSNEFNILANQDIAEFGTVSINHEWSSITLSKNYINPVIVASDPTFNGSHPAAVRIKDVDNNSFKIRLQEPNHMDGFHIHEKISYVAIESGDWMTAVGKRVIAGIKDSNKLSTSGFENVSYSNNFASSPVVMTQVQTFNGSDWVTTRTKDITNNSFKVAMQEEEILNNGKHVNEQIGWFATDLKGSVIFDGIQVKSQITSQNYDHNSNSIDLTDGDFEFNNTPALLTKVSSFVGSDTANSRISDLTSSGFNLRVHEEWSKDSELNHLPEKIAYVALSDGDESGVISGREYEEMYVKKALGAFAEYGTLSLNHEWSTISLNNDYVDPIIIASDPTMNGVHPVTVRLKNIDNNSFDIRLQEPNYLDGFHAYETVSYLAIESGDWTFDKYGSKKISAGSITSNKLSSQGFETINLNNISGNYMALTQVQTFNGSDWVTTRTKDFNDSNFKVSMQEEENLNNGKHVNEQIGWLAITNGYNYDTSNQKYRANLPLDYSSFHIDHDVNNGYIPTLVNTPVSIIAKLGTFNGSDTANVRVSNISDNDFYLRVHEEQSYDNEIRHIKETPSYFVLPGRSGYITGVDAAGWSSSWGFGRVSAARAFESLLGIELIERGDYGGNWWGLDSIDAADVWNGTGNFSGKSGHGATVAVVDTGVDLDHSEFQGRIVAGYDFVNNDSIADDDQGHGTHVAGTIAGANDGQGIIGVAFNAKIMPVKVLDQNGSGSSANVAKGIRWAVDNGADVINLSLGSSYYNSEIYNAVRYATQQGAILCMASGNDYGYRPGYPARHANEFGIAVGATNIYGNIPGFSNYAGSTLMNFVHAPGQNIYSAKAGGGYLTLSGTSMATPHVAGIAALLKGYNGSLNSSQISSLLSRSGHRISGTSSSIYIL